MTQKKKREPKTAALVYEHFYYRVKGYRCIVGLDEAGRGAWAGPVSAGAVCLPLEADDLLEQLRGVRDSKEMTARQRGILVEQVKLVANAWGVGSASSTEIDAMGINAATLLAMERALDALMQHATPDCMLLDTIKWESAPIDCEQVHIKKGDKQSLTIAAASVLAKTWRDDHMRELEQHYPGYEFAAHKGYGTAKHRNALKQWGPSPVHRRCYRPIQALLEG